MIIATPEQVKFANDKYEVAPWAAGKPGSMFDKPSDVLYCDFRGPYDASKKFAVENDISLAPHQYSTKWNTDHTLSLEGYRIQTHQCFMKMTFYRGCDNFDEITRQMDIVLPLMLDTANKLTDYTGKKIEQVYAMGKLIQIFEPSLSQHTIWSVFESGGEWMLLDLKRIVKKYASRDEMLEDCRERFGWKSVGESDMSDDEYEYEDE